MENLSALKPRLPRKSPERLLFVMRNGTWLVETIRCPAGDACIAEREGQRSKVPRQQAGHKTASDKIQLLQKKACKKGAIHTGPFTVRELDFCSTNDMTFSVEKCNEPSIVEYTANYQCEPVQPFEC